MIFDTLKNIDLYESIPVDVKNFIHSLTPDIELGRVELLNGNYVNIEKYTTKPVEQAKFESHKKYTDIQILLSGKEKIYFTDNNNLSVSVKYDSVRDIIFYSDKVDNYPFAILDGSNFVIFPPDEAHAPQVSSDICENVLKVVVKIKAQ